MYTNWKREDLWMKAKHKKVSMAPGSLAHLTSNNVPYDLSSRGIRHQLIRQILQEYIYLIQQENIKSMIQCEIPITKVRKWNIFSSNTKIEKFLPNYICPWLHYFLFLSSFPSRSLFKLAEITFL